MGSGPAAGPPPWSRGPPVGPPEIEKTSHVSLTQHNIKETQWKGESHTTEIGGVVLCETPVAPPLPPSRHAGRWPAGLAWAEPRAQAAASQPADQTASQPAGQPASQAASRPANQPAGQPEWRLKCCHHILFYISISTF